MTEPIKVLFVCLGNICRSPMAEGIFRKHVLLAGLKDKITCGSCGTSGHHSGEFPDRRAIKISAGNEVDISRLVSRQFRKTDFSEFHYLIVMDEDNKSDVERFERKELNSNAEIRRMREFDPTPGDSNVPDPWYGGEEDFKFVFRTLDRSCEKFLAFIRERHGI